MNTLNKETAKQLASTATILNGGALDVENQIVHIGIGGFHRSHQAFALAKLINTDPEQYQKWQITGVGLMPNDLKLVEHFNQQDHIYALRTIAYDKKEKTYLISTIKDMLHSSLNTQGIIDKIANPNTKIISFTITEGGYLVDFDKNQFQIDNVDIQYDLQHRGRPRTVFGFLAAGLAARMAQGGTPLIMMSCDNILGNGDVLRLALLSFLEAYDPQIREWVASEFTFPNSMVDRITPITTEKDKDNFEEQYGLRDNCLVVSEDFFQWVIEMPASHDDFPPLDQVGVQFVQHVAPYEGMKLGILNAGHTLVGLLGDAFGYDRIHDAVQDRTIWKLFELFVDKEVIPVLEPIDGVDFKQYFEQVRTRFANPMINDSTARIISGTSDKFPKFVLPTIQKQLKRNDSRIDISALIVALWWKYLNKQMWDDNMAYVQDSLKEEWLRVFQDELDSADEFLAYSPVFGELSDITNFNSKYKDAIAAIRENRLGQYIDTILF